MRIVTLKEVLLKILKNPWELFDIYVAPAINSVVYISRISGLHGILEKSQVLPSLLCIDIL